MNSPFSPQRELLNSAQLEASKKAKWNFYSHPSAIEEFNAMLDLAWPVTIATIARVAMYNIDTAFLGHLGVDQLAGGALAMCIVQFITVK